MSKIGGDQRFQATDGKEVSSVPDGYVVYDEPADKVHYLNPTAAVIYTLCDGTKSVSEIGAFLKDAYELEEDPDLEAVFSNLIETGLVCPIE